MSAQVQLLRARSCVPATAGHPPAQPAPWGPGSSEPQITLSPASSSSGEPTRGFRWMVLGSDGTFARVFMRDPATGFWGVLQTFAGVDYLGSNIWNVVDHLGAAELYFETDAPIFNSPPVLVLVMEIS